MPRAFNNQDRVRVAKKSSNYFGEIGTIVEMDSFGFKVALDGYATAYRFLESELEKVHVPKLPMTRTKKYLEELDEDAQTLYNAADIMPQGNAKTEIFVAANNMVKMAAQLRLVLSQDGIDLSEDTDADR